MYANNQTPFVTLLNLRRQFMDSSDKAVDYVNRIFTGQQVETVLTDKVVGSTGNLYEFIANGQNTVINEYAQNSNALQNVASYSISGDITNQVYQDIKPTASIENYAGDLSQVISDISNGAGFNAAIASIAGLYLNSNKVSLSDLSANIRALDNVSSNDINRLLQLCANYSYDGKIDNMSFLSLVNALSESSKSETDDNDLVLDTTKPLIIQSFVSTVVAIADVLLPTICMALSSILGGLISMIGMVIHTFINGFKLLTDDTLNLLDDTSTGLVDGPLCYLTTDRNLWPSTRPLPSGLSSKDLLFFRGGCMNLYRWGKGDTYYYNVFLDPTLDFEAIFDDYIANRVHLVESAGNHSWYVKFEPLALSFFKMENASRSDFSQSISDLAFATKKIALELLLIASMGMFRAYKDVDNYFQVSRYLVYDDHEGGSNIDNLRDCYANSCTSSELFKARAEYFVLNMIWRHFLDNGTGGFSIDEWISRSGINIHDALSVIQTFYRLCASSEADKLPLTRDEIQNSITTNTGGYTYLPINQWVGGVYYPTGHSNLSTYNLVGDMEYDQVDIIPAQRTFGVPSLSGATVIRAMVVTGLIAAAGAVAGSLISRSIKKRKFVKQLKAKESLSSARQSYLDDPSSTEALNNFYKAQKSYNFKAKIFGWSSYDATNDWFNDYNGSASNSSLASDLFSYNELKKLITG